MTHMGSNTRMTRAQIHVVLVQSSVSSVTSVASVASVAQIHAVLVQSIDAAHAPTFKPSSPYIASLSEKVPDAAAVEPQDAAEAQRRSDRWKLWQERHHILKMAEAFGSAFSKQQVPRATLTAGGNRSLQTGI